MKDEIKNLNWKVLKLLINVYEQIRSVLNLIFSVENAHTGFTFIESIIVFVRSRSSEWANKRVWWTHDW